MTKALARGVPAGTPTVTQQQVDALAFVAETALHPELILARPESSTR